MSTRSRSAAAGQRGRRTMLDVAARLWWVLVLQGALGVIFGIVVILAARAVNML